MLFSGHFFCFQNVSKIVIVNGVSHIVNGVCLKIINRKRSIKFSSNRKRCTQKRTIPLYSTVKTVAFYCMGGIIGSINKNLTESMYGLL